MPNIAEVREVDGQIWVRLDLDRMPSGIGIYTPEEERAMRRATLNDACWAVREFDGVNAEEITKRIMQLL